MERKTWISTRKRYEYKEGQNTDLKRPISIVNSAAALDLRRILIDYGLSITVLQDFKIKRQVHIQRKQFRGIPVFTTTVLSKRPELVLPSVRNLGLDGHYIRV